MIRKQELAAPIYAGAITISFLTALTIRGVPLRAISGYVSNFELFLASWLVLATIQLVVGLVRNRPASPLSFAREMFGKDYFRSAIRGLPIIAAILVFMVNFSTMKSAIPLFNEFTWDHTFIEMDRTIHGADPWRLFQPIFGYPFITSAISILYHLWIMLIYCGSVYWAVYVADRKLVCRYFLAYLTVWSFGGVFLATIFASVGPCFAGPLLGIDTFDAQMAYLREADAQFPVLVLDVQQTLLSWHNEGNFGLGRGITAMPSMHVALAFLFYLGMRHINKRASYFFGAFCVLIFIGSVHLGYHYAVDGYASIALTLIVWKLAGLVTKTDRAAETASPARAAEAC